MKRIIIFILITIAVSSKVSSQTQAYFVDGYHGGIYGHYPMWVTQFMVDKLAQHPEWRIGLEIEPETWDTVRVKDTKAYNNFKNIITDKRIEFTNPTYAQPYCYNISGESLIRQFEYGIKKLNQHFPEVTFSTYSAEEPCFTSCLPQILKLFGFKYAVLKCPDTCWGGYTAAYGGQLVNWIGPDGTSILTVPRYACEALEDHSTWQTKAWNNSDSYLKACFDYGIKMPVGMCYQDAGWKNGPWIGNGNNIKNNSIYVTWKDYIENISEGKSDDNWHFSQENVLVNLMWGSQVLQRIAQEVRVSENKIVMAEKIAAMATIDNNYKPLQTSLDDAWRTLMMAQHHDSWIVPYNRLNEKHTWAQEITLWTNNTNDISDNIIKDAIKTYDISNILSSDNLPYIRVYNTLAIERSELVKINLSSVNISHGITVYDSKKSKTPSSFIQEGDSVYLIFKAKVPPFGYATYSLQDKQSKPEKYSTVQCHPNGDYTVQNDMYKIIISSTKGGIIKSLTSKDEDNKEYIDITSEYNFGELRGYFYEDEKYYSSADSLAKVTILEENNLRTILKIEGNISSHPYTQIITLNNGQRRIDFDLTIDWKNNVGIGEYKQGHNWRENRRAFVNDKFKLNVMFPLNLHSAKLYKNAPFDVCESNLKDTFFNTWDSIKHNIILNWIDLVDRNEKYGFALLSDHTTSYSHGEDFPLSLTAQYSGIGLWGVDYKITKPLKMKYAIIPHSGKWDYAGIATESNKWNEPLVYSFHKKTNSEDKCYFDAANSGYEVTAFKSQGDDLIIRLFNAEENDSEQKLNFGFPLSAVKEIDLNGNVIAEKTIEKNNIHLSIPRFGIKTLLIKR
ncbi:alpha-mannosidase [Dysgonomonas sp. Marseille-P4677]|uniref:glycoside hydrolase family 38 N-terminal domain-containing protein n=1 Tax=Dysgonomonas sp. Marseille-P4677 TaxID=2364790 RepID=UPI00191128EF|nr:glycoside hydrolase family 38 C-terminal domain-containing protein [Dysgonomonas sp. Marseille-P4677]MBK5720012.1 alpha-mannosidase [Dysgonomonas sp. Marseille-P4677]